MSCFCPSINSITHEKNSNSNINCPDTHTEETYNINDVAANINLNEMSSIYGVHNSNPTVTGSKNVTNSNNN